MTANSTIVTISRRIKVFIKAVIETSVVAEVYAVANCVALGL